MSGDRHFLTKFLSVRRTSGVYFLGHIAIIAFTFTLAVFQSKNAGGMVGILVVFAIYVIWIKKMDYLDPFVGYIIPWMMVLFLSLIPISHFAVPIHPKTYLLVLAAMSTALFVSGGRDRGHSRRSIARKQQKGFLSGRLSLFFIESIFFIFTWLNIAIAGYIPLLRGVETGNTGYIDFGVPGVYGFYLAFANALGIASFYLYLKTERRRHLYVYFLVLSIFLLFVTRQNMIALIIEAIALYSVVRKRIDWKKIVIILMLMAIAFSMIGAFRTGDIKEIANVSPEYQWVPDPVVWLYAYSYFNIANFDNLVMFSNAPYYDGSSMASFLPSFLRPRYETGAYLLVSNFNVSSYLFPLYQDTGGIGIVLITGVMLSFARKMYRSLDSGAPLSAVGTYAVLYYCTSFSFFGNFWFYLPIIFQIVFFYAFSNTVERVVHEVSSKDLALKDKRLPRAQKVALTRLVSQKTLIID
ncbi:MAG TPA: O-antigen polymerase [Edaphobacter sp.]|nr:O-antigen polymerase [Edaphobacter sp.]